MGTDKAAASLRDAINQIASRAILRINPPSRVATVIAVNQEALVAEVQLAGDEGSFNATFGKSNMPRGAGVLVRIGGKTGAYYIQEILDDTGLHATYEPIIPLVDGSVAATTNEYSVNSSETVAPTTGWSTATPTRNPGTFVWFRTNITRNDGSVEVTNPALLTGNAGATGSQGVPGPAGANGQPTYTWIKYGDSPTTGMSDLPSGKTYMGIAYNKLTQTESSTYADYEWSLIQGPQGNQGVQGPVGANGQPTYTWIKYGTSSTGAGLTDSPTGMTYIGLAHNKLTATESTVATDYTWSLIQGPQGPQGTQGSQGIQGPAGANGQPTYTWIKYGDSPTTGMSDLPTGKTYMGIAYNKLTQTESSTYSDYEWSLIQGPQGNQGVQGPVGANGQPTYTWIKYGTSSTGAGLQDSPTGMTYLGIAYNKLTATESTTATDYEWSLIQGPQGATGSQGIQGPAGANGQPTYTWIKYGDSPTTGMSDLPTGKTYMGIAYNKLTQTESSTYSDYEWSLIQGPQGNQGIQGPTGANGQPTYTWIKYGTSSTGAGLQDSPTGMTYLGIAYNKTTATESTVATDYEWSLIQGPQGNTGPQGSQGVPGPTGANGQPTYTWIKYGDSPTTGMSDLPTGKTYLGIAYNKLTQTESSTYSDYEWSLIQGPQGNQGVAGPTGANGQPTYTWIKYGTSAAGAGLTDSPTGMTYIGIAYNKLTATESTTATDYEWSLIQGPQGPQGNQGIQGPVGANGQPTYTWIKYGTSAAGAGLQDTPTGMTYMGIAYNKLTQTESTTPGDYEWSLIQGPQGNQGIQGPVGANGQPTYTWIKYGTSAAGAGLSDSPTGMTYIGIAYNKTTATESTTPGDYEWSLIQGPQGTQGNPGAQGNPGVSATSANLGNDAVAIPVSTSGQALAAGSITVPFSGWVGSTRVAATIAAGTLPAGITLGTNTAATSGADGSLVLNYALNATIGAADVSNLILTITANSIAFPRTLSISRAYSGPQGGVGTSATSLNVTPDVFLVPTDSAGNALATSSARVDLKGFVGSTASNVTIGTAPTLPAGVTATPSGSGTTNAFITFNWTSAANIGGAAASGFFTWPITVNGVPFSANIGWARALQGTQGNQGNQGKSITAVTPFWAKVAYNAAAPANPGTVATPPAPWVSTEPAFSVGTKLYTTERITYSDTTYTYTTVALSSTYQAVATDGLAPATTPTPIIRGAVKSIAVTLPAVTNPDPVTMDLWAEYGATPATTGAPLVSIPVGSVAPALVFIRTVAGREILPTDVVHVITKARDADGSGPASAVATGSPALVTSDDVVANLVTTAMLRADGAMIGALQAEDLSAVTFTGTTIETRATAERGIKFGKVGDAELLIAYKENGDIFFKVDPNAGVTLTTGEARVQTLTVSSDDPLVTPGSSLGGVTEIAAGGRVLLTGGTTAPKSAPTVTAGYDQVQFTDDGFWPERRGWVTNGTDWFTARVSFNRPVLERWSSAGTLLQSATESAVYITSGGLMGLTIMGGAIYTLSRPTDTNFFVNKWNITTLAREAVGGASGLLWAESDGVKDAAIGSDGTDLLIAQTRASLSNKVHIRRYTNGGGAALVAGTWVETTVAWDVHLRSVLLTSADFAASRYVLMRPSGADVRTITTGGVFQTGEYFPPGVTDRVGLAYHNSAFRTMDTSGIMRTYTSNWSTTVANQVKWVSNTLANATVETDQSPRTRFDLPQRARLDVGAAPIVAGGSADRIQIYVGQGGGLIDPGRAAMYRQTSPTVGVSSMKYYSLSTSSIERPPAGNLFPKGALCDIVSSTGSFAVDSDSNGSVGTGTFRDSIIAALQARVREGSFTAVITAADTTVETVVTFATPFPATVPIPTHVNMTLQNVTGSPSVRVSVKTGTLTRSGFTAQTWRSVGSVNLVFTYHVESVG